jgi:CHAT domain-containing protein
VKVARPTWINAATSCKGWAALYAGANAVMATLWPVDDVAAMVFAHRFHTHLHDEGISLAGAYQAALQDLQMRRYMGTKLNPFF